jgi:hypothetical protein
LLSSERRAPVLLNCAVFSHTLLKVFDRLMSGPAAHQDAESLEKLVELLAARLCLVSAALCSHALQPLELTNAEVVQLVNCTPRTVVELHCCVESCAQRLTEAEQQDLITLLQSFSEQR